MARRKAPRKGELDALELVDFGRVLIDRVFPCTWCGAMVDLDVPQAGVILTKYATEPGRLPVVMCFECDLPEFDEVKAKRHAARTAWLTRGWRP